MKKVFKILFFLLLPLTIEAQTITLPKVVVTASRIEEKETASSITILDGEELKKQGVINVTEALHQIPGISITQYGFGGATSVYIRGGKNGQAAILIDGVPIYDPAGIDKGDLGAFLSHLQIEDIDRIEIVRGPQSILYGSNAMTGVINIITKKGIGKPKIKLLTEGGSFNTSRESLTLSGGKEDLNYFLNYTRFDSDGISKTNSKSSYFDPDKDAYREHYLGGKADLKFSDKVRFGFSLRYINAEQELDGWNDFENDRLFFTQLYYEQDLFPMWEHNLRFSYTSTNRKYEPYDFYEGTLTDFSWQHNFKLFKFFKVITGFDYRYERANTSYIEEKDLDEKAWFGEGIFNYKNLYISLGVRYTDVQDVGNKTTYRFAGAYTFPTQTKIHISYGTGFRAPSLYQLYGKFLGISVGNPNLKPEYSEGFDVGITQWFLNKKLSFDITYFYNDIDDLIDFDWIKGYLNIGEVYTQGIEISIDILPLSWWQVGLFYTWLNAKDLTNDTWLLKRPHHKFGFSTVLSLDKCYLGIYGNYVGHYSDYLNTQVKSYFVMHAALRYKINRHISFHVRVNNLFDRDYEETYGFNTPGISAYGGAEIIW